MARRTPPRKVTYFEPVPPRLARNTVIESTFEVGRRFRRTMRGRRGSLGPCAQGGISRRRRRVVRRTGRARSRTRRRQAIRAVLADTRLGGSALGAALGMLQPGGACVTFGVSEAAHATFESRDFFATGGLRLYGLTCSTS